MTNTFKDASWRYFPGLDQNTEKRSILLLQGPAGPFFRLLQGEFEKVGHDVTRINYSGGDWLDARFRGVAYKGGDYKTFILDLHSEKNFTDLICYGDARPYHKEAITYLKAEGVRIFVLEEGYLRPDHVTLETDGVNAYSALSVLSETDILRAKDLGPVPFTPVGASMPSMKRAYMWYYFTNWLWKLKFPNPRAHRKVSILSETSRWISAFFASRTTWKAQDSKSLKTLGDAPYFIVPLQLDQDAQRSVHSDFDCMLEFGKSVLASFAKTAPCNHMLVFKRHPLDSHAGEMRRALFQYAQDLGVADRIVYLYNGSWPELVKRASGCVTINSTAGLSALHHGIATIAMGRAFWNKTGFTWQRGINAFWLNAKDAAPSSDSVRNLERLMRNTCLVNGSFFTRRGRAILLDDLRQKIIASRKAALSERLVVSVAPSETNDSETNDTIYTELLGPRSSVPLESQKDTSVVLPTPAINLTAADSTNEIMPDLEPEPKIEDAPSPSSSRTKKPTPKAQTRKSSAASGTRKKKASIPHKGSSEQALPTTDTTPNENSTKKNPSRKTPAKKRASNSKVTKASKPTASKPLANDRKSATRKTSTNKRTSQGTSVSDAPEKSRVT